MPKTDTQYFQEAMAAWCAKNKYSANLPLTPSVLSTVLLDAQRLKDADKARIDNEGATA
jgi:hypothetical protein